MLLGDRYEVVDKIGTGGMSDVFKAKDHKLNRFVAVKVLKQEFSENANFVSKFRVEAQAAAGLMHPNIVNVYDVGEEAGDIYYIVMELVEGITLKSYIEKKARLSYKEALSIAIQIAMGIEAAHNNNIIHRDIKPQNIIISKEGKVKVTDFGIAKAATSNTVTSNVMGSVHYTSPEQARGGYSDEKSDIYSLGITMFEMLTGRVPFNGETTVAIAIKHIQEAMPSPCQFVSEIPLGIEKIVMKCCNKSIDRRYQSMAALIVDLKYGLMNPEEDFVDEPEADELGGTKVIDRDVEAVKESISKTDKRIRIEKIMEETIEEEELRENQTEKITTIIMAAVCVMILVLAVIIIVQITGVFQPEEGQEEETTTTETQVAQVEMIAVEDMKVEIAKSRLEDLGFQVEVLYEISDTVVENIVISADKEAGELLLEGDLITLTVSAGQEMIELPSVVGYSEREALNILDDLGFVVNISEAYDDEVEVGDVISQTPKAGSEVTNNTEISIRISLGEEESKVRVPNVIGLTLEAAKSELETAGITVGESNNIYNENVASGLVCEQSHPVGSYVEEGTVVNIGISLGAEKNTYSYQGEIQAPSVEEAPQYKAGDVVELSVVADNGQLLLSTETSSFPYSVSYTGITAESGTITITYQYEVVVTQATETQAPVTEKKTATFTRKIAFTEER